MLALIFIGQYDKAIHYHEKSLNIAKQIGDKAGEGKAYGNLGVSYDSLGQYDKAIEHHEKHLNITKQIRDKAGEGQAYRNLGLCYYSLRQCDKAIDHHEKSLNMAKQIGDKPGEGKAYGNLGLCYYSLGQYDEAVDHHEKHLNITKQIGDRAGEGAAYGNLGDCYCFLGRYDEAVDHHEKSLNIAKQIGDRACEGAAYGSLGLCYYSWGQYNKAIDHHEKHLNIAKQIGDRPGEGKAYGNLGICLLSLGQCDKAIDHHEKHLNIAKQIGDKAGEGTADGNLGLCYYSLGQYDKAIDHHEKDLNIAKQIRDKAGEGQSYGNLGLCYYSLGQYDKAIDHHEKYLNIAKQIGDKPGEGRTYGNLGNCYYSLGQYDKAVDHHEKSLDIAKQIGDKPGEGKAYGNLGLCYYSLGQHDKAVDHHEKHLNITKQIRDKAGEGAAYGNLGVCYWALGQYSKAIDHHKKRLNIAEQIRDKAGEGQTYGNLGLCYYFLEQYSKAKDEHEKYLNIAKQIGDKAGEGRAYGNLSLCYYSLGQYDEAQLTGNECVTCYEELWKSCPKMDEVQISIRETIFYAYRRLSRTLLRQNKIRESLVIEEKGRSRSLAELVFKSYSVGPRDAPICNLSEIEQVVAGIDSSVLFLSLDGSETYFWIIQPSGDVEFKKYSLGINRLELKGLISAARTTYGVPCEIKCEDRSLSLLYPGELEEQREVESVLSLCATPSDVSVEKIKEFSCCRPHSAVIPKESKHVAINTTNPTTNEKRNAYEEEGSGVDDLNQLYHMILEPVRGLIQGPRLVIVPDRELNLVPYAALKDDEGQYVVDCLQVRLIPSFSTAKIMMDCPQQPQSGATPLIIGDPDTDGILPRLKFAHEEAVEIGGLLNVQPLLGKDATKKNVLQHIENANLVHIAAHGDRERGQILLAPNGNKDKPSKDDYMLMMSDLENKCMMAKLVVLSCCHSAKGEIKSEGVVGLARAFLGAGARSVLVALWAIDDKATLFFMKEFYKDLKSGKKTNESLSQAMKTMKRTKTFSEPWYWAPFVLIGDDVTVF